MKFKRGDISIILTTHKVTIITAIAIRIEKKAYTNQLSLLIKNPFELL